MSIDRLIEDQVAPQVYATIKAQIKTEAFKKGVDDKVIQALKRFDVSDMVDEILYDNNTFYKIVEKEVKASLKKIVAAAAK